MRRRAPWLAVLLGTAMGVALACSACEPALLEPSSQAAIIPAPTRWRSPDGMPKPRHTVPAKGMPFVLPRVVGTAEAEATEAPQAGWRGRVCLVVADGIYDAIAPALDGYRQDLESDGYEVTTYRFVSGSAGDVRGFLAGLYGEAASLVGAVLIGDIPYIIYELMQDWGDGGPLGYEDFPCDIFFMDLDGAWTDELEEGDVHAGNGKYDTRAGELGLEIWVCRLKTGNLGLLGSETAILANYFAKNHRYRAGRLRPECRALAYLDDDWSYISFDDAAAIGLWYAAPAIDMVDDPNATTASDYMYRLGESYELIHTRSHGSPGGHEYGRDDGTVWDWVMVSDYVALAPEALFYSFYVCSGADYTFSDYLAGVAAFNTESGLMAWGSAKTGGMWIDDPFYASLGAGESFGEAFITWYNYVQSVYPEYAPRYWYGMALIGDATLPGQFFADVGRDNWAFREIETCVGAEIVGGYEDRMYEPGWLVSRDQMAVFISRSICTPTGEAGMADYTPPETASFTDVPTDYWAYKHIEYAVEHEVVTGYGNGIYDPGKVVNRDQMAVFIARALAGSDALVPAHTGDPTFGDVPEDYWAHDHIEYIAGEGIASGYFDGLYHPEYFCSRDQMAVYITRAFNLLSP